MPKNNLKLLNLGCGQHYHREWINVDFSSKKKDVIAYNLLKGIPFEDNLFDVVYHSHLLEHFSKEDVVKFIKECSRVLKPGGIIRIATPDLEMVVNNYRRYLNLCLRKEKNAEFKYDWTMIEMYDQCVRNFAGGEMSKIYSKGNISNPDFIYERTGIRVKRKIKSETNTNRSKINIKDWLLKLILGKEFKYYRLGKFRLSGEVHQWMYDRFSLARLLRQTGFKEIKVCKAWESRIPNWSSFNLDTNPDGTIYKPDSFYIEAIKGWRE